MVRRFVDNTSGGSLALLAKTVTGIVISLQVGTRFPRGVEVAKGRTRRRRAMTKEAQVFRSILNLL
jgi:hypothetical protein